MILDRDLNIHRFLPIEIAETEKYLIAFNKNSPLLLGTVSYHVASIFDEYKKLVESTFRHLDGTPNLAIEDSTLLDRLMNQIQHSVENTIVYCSTIPDVSIRKDVVAVCLALYTQYSKELVAISGDHKDISLFADTHSSRLIDCIR